MPYIEGVGIPYLQLASPYDNIHTVSDIDLQASATTTMLFCQR